MGQIPLAVPYLWLYDRIVRRNKAATKTPPAFVQFLKDNGWLLKTAPMSILAGLGMDEYIFVERRDRLVHVHISPEQVSFGQKTGMDWEARRYVREPFGDYTMAYQPLGKGDGFDSLKTFVEQRNTSSSAT